MSLYATYEPLKDEAKKYGIQVPDKEGTIRRIRNYLALGWIHRHPERYIRRPLDRRQRLETLVIMKALELGLRSLRRRKLPLEVSDEELKRALEMNPAEFIRWFEEVAPVLSGEEKEAA